MIAIIGVLLAISLPFLSSVRKQGQTAEALAAQRQYSAALAQYVQTEQDYLPFLGVVGQPDQGVFPARSWPNGAPSYFRGQSTYWPTALLAMGIDLATLPQNQHRGDQNDQNDLVTTYVWLTHSAAARPEYWTGVDPPDNSGLFAGARLDECAFPSNKGLLANVGLLDERAITWDVSFGDGSASSRSLVTPTLAVPGLPRRYSCVPWRVLTTPGGIRGQDY